MKSGKKNFLLLVFVLSLSNCTVGTPVETPTTPIAVEHETTTPSQTEEVDTCIKFNLSSEALDVQGKVLLTTFTTPPILRYIESGKIVSGNFIELWNGETPTQFASTSFYTISPNGKLIAYKPIFAGSGSPEPAINIVDSDGNEIHHLEVNYAWGGFAWLDNHRLIIEDGIDTTFLEILDIDTSEKTPLQYKFPDQIYPLTDGLARGWFNKYGLFNSTLTRAIYPTDATEHTINLVNVKTNEVISSIQLNDYGISPVWSPDGTKLALISNVKADDVNEFGNEIFILQEDGSLTRETYFLETSIEPLEIGSLAWSSDNRYISFITRSLEQPDPLRSFHFAFLDTTTGDVREYCNPEGFAPVGMIWLPNDEYLVVSWVGTKPERQYSAFFSMETGYFYEVGSFLVGGWLVP